MKLALYQFNPQFGAKAANLNRIREVIRGHQDIELWILPELCTTGYQFISLAEANKLAEPFPGGTTAALLRELSATQQTAIITGVAEKGSSRPYNSAVLFDQGHYRGSYRKIHLFADEKRWFAAGQDPPPLFEVQGVKIGLMICFDWLFPEICRRLALQGAQMIAHPANLVLPYCQDAMLTRSIENRVFTATANRIGREQRSSPALTFTGQSQVTAPQGVRLAQSAEGEEVLAVNIDPDEALDKQITPQNHIFKDRRPTLYEMES